VGYAELNGISGKVRLYRIPRRSVAGIQPFGGQALDRVLNSVIPSEALAPAVEHAKDLAQKGSDVALRGFTWWQVEVRRSRMVQYIIVATVIALIGLMVCVFWPRQTPLRQLRRMFKF